MHSAHKTGGVLHQESLVCYSRILAIALKLKRERNFENAELGSEKDFAVRRDGNMRGCINLCRPLYKVVAIIIRFKWQLRGLDGLL